MKCKKEELQRALEIVKPGLAGKELIEQTTSFAFVGRTVITYNDRISLRHPVKGVDIEGAIQAKELYALISKVKKDEIDVEINDTEIVFSSGRTKAGLTLQTEILLPLEETDTKKLKWKKLPETFIADLKVTGLAASTDMSTPLLTCVHVSKDGVMQATDSYKMCYVEGEALPIEDAILFPAEVIPEIVKIKPLEIAENNGWCHFKNKDKTVLSCRINTPSDMGEFPQLKNYTNLKQPKAFTFPKTIMAMLERASVFAIKEHAMDSQLEIEIKENKIHLSAEKDCGWFKENGNLKYAGDPFLFKINPILLDIFLTETLDCEVGSSKIKFQFGRVIYIAMLRGKSE